MNCHGSKNQDSNNNKKRHKGHGGHMMLMMVLCCAIPIVLLLLLPILKIDSPALKSILPFAILILCPLMHVMMIPMMFRKDKSGNSKGSNTNNIQGDQQLHIKQGND
ncbi:MAG: hypothetical protein CVV02_02320 [Firmicutes bacterium HGW-Firmicutes-7]|nr:MAG: hypothetical protein CVV02_02320 [Firmicutes bacterium HGW-Firmicutes-7]